MNELKGSVGRTEEAELMTPDRCLGNKAAYAANSTM